MDSTSSSSNDPSKNVNLENLSKEELIKKYQFLLGALQKVKQAKAALGKETTSSKPAPTTTTVSEEVIQSLTQQKLELVTALEDVKTGQEVLRKHLDEFIDKNSMLDTENEGFKRQIGRLTEENEQLFVDLARSEREIDELKKVGLEQREQLLVLERVAGSEEEIIKLQEENSRLKAQILDKSNQIEENVNKADDLTTELHKNKALVEKLKLDLTNTSSKLADNQIMSSGVTSDLQNTNDRLQDQLGTYRDKIANFAGYVKILRQNKNEILADFKAYVVQVKSWEGQLREAALRLVNELRVLELKHSELQVEWKLMQDQYENEKSSLSNLINDLQMERDGLKLGNERLGEENERLAAAVEVCESKLQEHVNLLATANNTSQEKINSLSSNEAKMISEISGLQSDKENLILKVREMELSNQDSIRYMTDEINQLNINVIKSENQKVELQGKIDEIQNELDEASKSLEMAKEEQLKQDEKVGTMRIEFDKRCLELESKIADMEQLKTKEDEISELLVKIESFNQILTERDEAISRLAESNKMIQGENEELSVSEKAQKENLNQLTVRICELESQTAILERTKHDLVELTKNLESRNTELLQEMNLMNQALKERGETISKLEQCRAELLKKVNDLESSQGDKSEIVLLKNDEIEKLQTEIAALKESSESNYAESETMSMTSAISKSEESNRMREIEGSWEEKYLKLRTIAVKLKKKIQELNQEVTQKNEKIGKGQQVLQSECDRLQDELDASTKEAREYAKKLDVAALEISSDKKRLAEADENSSQLKAEIEVLTKEKSNTENWKKQVSAKVQNLKKELDANVMVKKDFEAQITKLKEQIETKEKSLKTEKEKHAETKTLLQEIQAERKKKSVLDLEMQDYERSLKDLSLKLDRKQEEITKLKNQLDTQKSSAVALKEQNRLLEERVQNEESEVKCSMAAIQGYKKTISDLETAISQKDDKIQDLTGSLEQSRAEVEDLSTQLSVIVANHQKLTETYKTEKDQIRAQNLGLEQRLHETQETLRTCEDELKRMQHDYDGYKVRAQSILRQNQTRDVGLEEKLSVEADSLKAQLQVLSLETRELKLALEKAQNENQQLTQTTNSFKSKCEETENKLQAQETSYQELTDKYQKIVQDHSETVRNLKIHADTLAQCYRQQISEQEVRHNREIVELQGKLDKTPAAPEPFPFVPPSIPREDGEGSESIESSHSPTSVHPIPLEKLLSAEIDGEFAFIKKALVENETKVGHLTALLADTEQDLAKHVQMNNLLKEEIRRQQRSVEREKHAENLEYLKNVMFKFITLSTSEEKVHLVPVLNTILKLSPEETQKLNAVARGEGAGKSGWSNYLPGWSSKPS